jgi:hypothetical protein
MFTKAPSEVEWQTSLSAQTRLQVTACEAFVVVRTSWASACGEKWD